MAELATYVGVLEIPIQVNSTNPAVTVGYRVTTQSDGSVAVQDNTARGDYVVATISIPQGAAGIGYDSMYGCVPAYATEATTTGNLAYTGAAGGFSQTSSSNVLMGRWIQGAASGTLGMVKLFTVA